MHHQKNESDLQNDQVDDTVSENSVDRTFDKARFYGFLRTRNKPSKGAYKQYKLPKKNEGEDPNEYAERCYETVGVRPVATGPLKMPGPNTLCPCKATYEDGKRKKFKKCCGRGF